MSELFKILPRRMPQASLPTYATNGELIITTDTNLIYVGKGPSTPIQQVGGGSSTTLPTGSGNKIVATPADGSSAASALRSLVAADIPALPYDASGLAASALSTAQSFATSAVAAETSRAETAEGLLAPKASPTFTGTVSGITAAMVGADASGAAAAAVATEVTNRNTAIAVETSRAETAEGLLALKTTTVNGHALSANVIVSASDITTGTLPHAQLPTLLSGDIPNNAANTSGSSASCTGNAATATNLAAAVALPAGTTATTQAALDNSLKLATTAYADAAVGVEKARALAAETLLAPIASPTFTGTVGGITYAMLSGSPAWNVEGNATGNMAISNAAFTTTFNQTAAVAWLWANTTAATGSTINASPLLELAAQYYTGSASATDTWTIGTSLAAGTNAASVLNITHSGSSGQATVMLPAGAAGKPALQFTGASTGVGLSQSAAGGGYLASSGVLDIQTSAGVSSICIAPNGASGVLMAVGYYSGGLAAGTITMCGNVNGSSVPSMTLGNMNASAFNQHGGNSTGIAFGTGAGTGYGNLQWIPSAGSNNFAAVSIAPGINSTAVLVTQTITSCTITSATAATLTVTTGTNYTVGATIVVSGLTGGTNTQLNGTWVIASTAATTVVITGSGWTTHTAAADSGTITQTPGTYAALRIAPVETAAPSGVVHKLIDCYAGAAGTTPMFSVDNKGNAVHAGYIVLSTTTSPTSAATAGQTGQIAWDSGKIYVCTSGGAAGAATWKAATLTAV
ncbi:MAG TPA: hypothetical protein VKR59_07910 [Terriglobales bacterium]|nr:hypothetical protein [Terriglobales bacterium]